MEYGFVLPMGGPMASPENLTAIARRAEELDYNYIAMGDHIVIPGDVESPYPYAQGGQSPGLSSGWLPRYRPEGRFQYCLEQLSVLAYIAGQTSKIRLLTSVTILPHRRPVVAAKTLATIDVLSNGRLTVGSGAGWMREEFEAIGTAPFDERGAVTDEYIRAFKELWTSENPTFEGQYCRFSNITFLPKPVQKPHPPIWMGGESPPAMRRAARLANGWLPIGNNPRFPLLTPEQYAEAVGRLRGYVEEYGRDPAEIYLAFGASRYDEREASTLPDGQRRPFTGNAEQIAEDIRKFNEVGVRYLQLNLLGGSLEETLERVDYFARVVRPLAER